MKEDNHYNELVLGLSQRNETAIKLLFTMYFRSLCFFAEKIIGNSAEAEDLATDAFLKLIKAEKAFNCLEEIRSYLFTSVKNACIDRLRKQKREAVQLGGPFTTIADAPYLELLEREMLTAQLLQLVYAEIERLPEKCRRIFKRLLRRAKIHRRFGQRTWFKSADRLKPKSPGTLPAQNRHRQKRDFDDRLHFSFFSPHPLVKKLISSCYRYGDT